MNLVRPTDEYRESFIAALDETLESDPDNLQMMTKDLDIDEIRNDFSSFAAKLRSFAQGKNQPPGYVPGTIMWLIDQNEFIGQVSIRHQLTEYLKLYGGHIGYFIRPSARKKGYGSAILRLSIQEAHKLGIEEILLTCDTTNLASRKIIESCGGEFENTLPPVDDRPEKMRFWIKPAPRI